MKRFSLTIAAISAVCLTFQSAQATLLFSEAFDYTAGGGLSDQANPGGQTWLTGGNSLYLTIASGNLTYAGLSDLGGNSLQINNGTATSTYITFAAQTSGQIFYSFLFNATGADSGNNYFTALNASDSAKPAPNGGTDAIDAYFYSTGKMEVRGNAQSATAGTGPVLNLGQTYLIVEMIDLDAHTGSLWIDPTIGGAAPAADATLSSLTATKIDDVGFKAQSSAGGPYTVDNLRIGTTWADVTPTGVPEPSVLALAGLGIFGLIASARRRMQR